MSKRSILVFALLSMVLTLIAGPALADRCETCHAKPEFKVQHKKLFDYYNEFLASMHGIIGIGCVDCHGGDADSDDMALAHEGVMAKVRFDNIPTTCGACHDKFRAKKE